MKYVPINFALIKSPLNWATVILMVAIGAFAFEEILKFSGAGTGGCGCNRSLAPVPRAAIPPSQASQS